jgi:reactive intermediate/imine deaminase
VSRVLLLAALVAAARPAAAQERQIIRPPGPAPTAPYSPAVRVGNLLFLSGQIGVVPGQGLAPGGVEPETRQTLENIRRLLEVAGSAMDRVIKCTVFLADIADYQAMNAVYRAFFPTDPPARSAVAVAGLPANARVEIECIALAAPSPP